MFWPLLSVCCGCLLLDLFRSLLDTTLHVSPRHSNHIRFLLHAIPVQTLPAEHLDLISISFGSRATLILCSITDYLQILILKLHAVYNTNSEVQYTEDRMLITLPHNLQTDQAGKVSNQHTPTQLKNLHFPLYPSTSSATQHMCV